VWRRQKIDTRDQLRAAAHHGGVLLLMYDRRVVAMSAEGEVVADQPAGERYWHSGRFYRYPADARVSGGDFAWAGAHFDGRGVAFMHVTGRDSLAIFDREGHGPWQLLRSGQVASVGGPPRIVRNGPRGRPSHVEISRDGHRIITSGPSPESNFLPADFLDLNIDPLTWHPTYSAPNSLLIGDDFGRSEKCGLNVLNRFDAIYAGDAGDLVLVRGKLRLAIRLNSAGHLWLESAGGRDGTAEGALAFRRLRRRGGGRFGLRVARWADGSRAILDSRGMLHLTSTGAGLPEITLVLTDRTIGGWTSDGLTFGWQFFHRAAPTAPAEYVYGLLRTFTARLR
jgi:hypothetical protein